AAREIGVRVPADLSLVGINDIPMVNLLDPPLTTARVPQREMGAIAARMLIGLLEREPVVDRHVLLDTELIVRGSTAAPRSADRRVA
ncbi:MAG: LacI family transcriptional regulator, partial [Chloroflexi bacterium]